MDKDFLTDLMAGANKVNPRSLLNAAVESAKLRGIKVPRSTHEAKLRIARELAGNSISSLPVREDLSELIINRATWMAINEPTNLADKRAVVAMMLDSIRKRSTVRGTVGGRDYEFRPQSGPGQPVSSEEEWAVNERIFAVMHWILGPLRMQAPGGSRLHDFDDAVGTGKRFYRISDRWPAPPGNIMRDGKTTGSEAVHDFAMNAPSFVLEHDWSAALQAPVEGEVRMPFDALALECKIDGWRVLALLTTTDVGHTEMLVCTEYAHKLWTCIGGFRLTSANEWVWLDDSYKDVRALISDSLRVARLLGNQLRAVCIALDAEVAEAEVVRAPHKLNHARTKAGKLPLRDYHVIRLSNRRRSAPVEHLDGDELDKRSSPRWHYRRGHWVHYQSHKTWRSWCMVGNPDLGTIEKEYRL